MSENVHLCFPSGGNKTPLCATLLVKLQLFQYFSEIHLFKYYIISILASISIIEDVIANQINSPVELQKHQFERFHNKNPTHSSFNDHLYQHYIKFMSIKHIK